MRTRIILVLAFFALMFACSVSTAYLLLSTSYTSSIAGFFFKVDDGLITVTSVTPGEMQALRAGDEIVEFNGQRPSASQLRNFFVIAKANTPYSVVVKRGAETQQLTLRTQPTTMQMRLSVYVSVLLIPYFFQITGLIIFLLRPRDKQALLVALTFGMVGFRTTVMTLPVTPLWVKLLFVLASPMTSLMPAICLHFALIFPEPSRLLKRWPRLTYWIYAPVILGSLPLRFYNHVLMAIDSDRGYDFAQSRPVGLLELVLVVYVLASMAVLAMNYRHSNQAARRKLRVLVAGWIVGALPVMTVTMLIAFEAPVSAEAYVWLGLFATLVLLLIPISFAYAVVRHRVIPVSLIIRRSVQYVLAKNALRILPVLPLIGLVSSIVSHRNRSVADIVLRSSVYFYLLALVAILIGLLFRKRLSNWIDRRFFREQYNQDQILRELIDDVKRSDSMPEMSRLVSKKVDSALHPERVYLFYRQEDKRDLSLGYSSGGSSAELRIPQEFELLRFMEYQGRAQEFPFPQKTNLPVAEKDWLSSLGTNLIVPMTGTDNRLAGLFLLGQKKSEVPYTAGDRQLLEMLADQIAIVYENVRLKERIDRERRVRHEVLARVEDRKINLLKECPRCGLCYDSSADACEVDRAELTLTLPVERTIEERYRLDKLLGRGGMGAVYEAVDLRLNRRVAVKILSGQLFGNSAALRRFEREAQTSARLTHPNIITVYDYGVLSTEGAYLVMEFVRGKTLGTILKNELVIAPPVAAEWLDQILNATGFAHAAGVIHRDLKPENILISDDGAQVKILDFGLAKIAQPDFAAHDSSPVTVPGAVMGTFGYMSPEQLTGASVDHRTDLFSIGVITIEMLTGRRPFAARNYHEQLNAIMREPFCFDDERPETKELERLLQKCLSVDPDDRFGDAAEARAALIAAVRGSQLSSHGEAASLEAETIINPN
jgi:eukaryotic-like serine/threonine-protein kinase